MPLTLSLACFARSAWITKITQFTLHKLHVNATRDMALHLKESALTHELIHNYEPANQNDVLTHVSLANSAKKY